MSVTYYVALPFVATPDGCAPGQAQECPNEPSAVRRAEAMSRNPRERRRAGVQAHRRSGGWQLRHATVLRRFGVVPGNLDELGAPLGEKRERTPPATPSRPPTLGTSPSRPQGLQL